MRLLALLLVFSALLCGAYVFYLRKLPAPDGVTAFTQEITLRGVRSDLLQIAQAERANIASNGSCRTMPELLSADLLELSRTERDGYSYSVECSGLEFRVVARHAPAPAGLRLRYPDLAVDQNMQAYEVN